MTHAFHKAGLLSLQNYIIFPANSLHHLLKPDLEWLIFLFQIHMFTQWAISNIMALHWNLYVGSLPCFVPLRCTTPICRVVSLSVWVSMLHSSLGSPHALKMNIDYLWFFPFLLYNFICYLLLIVGKLIQVTFAFCSKCGEVDFHSNLLQKQGPYSWANCWESFMSHAVKPHLWSWCFCHSWRT